MNESLRPLIDRLAALGLHEWAEPVAVSREQTVALCGMAPHEGIACLLGAAIERGFVVVDSESADLVVAAWAERMVSAVQLDCVMLAVIAQLHKHGVPVRVLKGVAVAMLDESDTSWRSYGDVDVLVPPNRLLDAAAALAHIGFRPGVDPVGKRWAARHTKSITLVGEAGVQIDLHRLIAAGPFGTRVRAQCLFEQGHSFQVGGQSVVALSDVHRFVHACYHAALGGNPGTRHRRDVLLLAASTDPASLEQLVSEGWSTTVVANALRWADGGARVVPGRWGTWLSAFVEDPADRDLLRAYGGSFGDLARAELRLTRGVFAKARFAAALAWPSRANLAARHERRRDHLRRMIRAGRGGG